MIRLIYIILQDIGISKGELMNTTAETIIYDKERERTYHEE